MITRRQLLAGGAVTAGSLSTAVAACSMPGGPAGSQSGANPGAATTAAATPARITWVAWAGAGSETEQYELNVSEFIKQHPQHSVDFVNVGALAAISEKLITLSAAGTPPEVVQVHYSFGVDLASRGLLSGLDTYMARDRVRREDFVPGEIDEFAWKKVQYALPKDNALRALFYNLDLFDKAGVKYPTDTWTWDDFLDAAKKLTQPDPTTGAPTFGIHDFPLVINDSPSYSITRAFGGEWYNDTWTASTLDSPPTVEAIQFVADWRNRHRISPAPGELQGGG
ncbi:MAG TPA: extracellular solute-binding protein, partial [Chloroflexota bacterium]|nr:extracellular solute-binding protein [Chloroflexota bacterium]